MKKNTKHVPRQHQYQTNKNIRRVSLLFIRSSSNITNTPKWIEFKSIISKPSTNKEENKKNARIKTKQTDLVMLKEFLL